MKSDVTLFLFVLFVVVVVEGLEEGKNPKLQNIIGKFINLGIGGKSANVPKEDKITINSNVGDGISISSKSDSDPTPPGYPVEFVAHTYVEYVSKYYPEEDYYAEGITYHDAATEQLRNDMEVYFLYDQAKDFTSSKTFSPPLIYDLSCPGVGLLGCRMTCDAYEFMPNIPSQDNFVYQDIEFVGWEATDKWISFDPNTNVTSTVFMDLRNSNPVATIMDTPIEIITYFFDPMLMKVGPVDPIEFNVPARANCGIIKKTRAAVVDADVERMDASKALYSIINTFGRK